MRGLILQSVILNSYSDRHVCIAVELLSFTGLSRMNELAHTHAIAERSDLNVIFYFYFIFAFLLKINDQK